MPQPPSSSSTSKAVYLLRGAAIVFAFVGGGMAAWGLDKWIRYPERQASQFGVDAPLWPAFTVFALISAVVGVGLLWRAADRVQTGEDLFRQRHRRLRSDSKPADDEPEE